MNHFRSASVVGLISFYFFICSNGQYSTNTQEEKGPVVSLSTGKVQGLRVVSAVNRVYYSFRGIRYAAPPVGDLRFKPPQPVKPWNGTRKAFLNRPGCAQPWRKQAFDEIFIEDCLYINVFTPHIKPPRNEPMAVIVWIHGGKHYQGSGSSFKYGPDFQLPENVVLVTFNYRLGVFGYLNLNTKSAAGNQSLKDMVAALRWVKKEIHKFGGDPGRVTIAGGSSGGSDVHCLYISPMAQGPSGIPFEPSVDGDFDDEVFMPISPIERAESFHSVVPYMMGLNTGEGLMDVEAPDTNPTQFSEFEKNFYLYIPNDLREKADEQNMKAIIKRLKEFYFNNKPATFDSVYQFSHYMMDARLTHKLVRVARQISAHAPVYLWYFAFEGAFKQKYDIARFNLSGVNHGEELGYLFYRPPVIPQQTNLSQYPRECEVTTKMVKLWANFAKYGNPTPDEYDSVLNVTWMPLKNASTRHLLINESLTMVNADLLPERVNVWEEVWTLSTLVKENRDYYGVYIITFVLILALISLIYLVYTSSCRKNKYENIL